jgi:chromosome segregation ATPase
MSPWDILEYQMPEPFWHLQLSQLSLEQIQIGLAFVASFFFSIMMLGYISVLSRIPVNKKVVDAETLVLEYRTLYDSVLERIATLETELKAKDTQLGCELIEVQRNEHDHYLETTRLEAAVDAEFDANRKDMVEMVDDKIHELKEGVSMILSEKLDDLPISDMSDELTFLRESAISQKDKLDEQTKRLNGLSTDHLVLDTQIKDLNTRIKGLDYTLNENAGRLGLLAVALAKSEQTTKTLIKEVETRQTLNQETSQTATAKIEGDLKTVVQFLLIFYPKGTSLLALAQKNGWPVEAPSLPPPPAPPAPPAN